MKCKQNEKSEAPLLITFLKKKVKGVISPSMLLMMHFGFVNLVTVHITTALIYLFLKENISFDPYQFTLID